MEQLSLLPEPQAEPEFLSLAWHRMIAALHTEDGPCACKSCNVVRVEHGLPVAVAA